MNGLAHSQPLDRVADLLRNPANIDAMIALSERGRPAVQAIGKQVADIAPGLDDTQKQHVGRMVRDVLAERGLKPERKARVAAGHFFSWGAVYRRIDGGGAAPGAPAAAPPETSASNGMDALRDMVRDLPAPPPRVDEFLTARKEIWGA